MPITYRISHHRSAARRGVRGHPILRAGVDPEVVKFAVLGKHSCEEKAHESERFWIAHYGRKPAGFLVNRSGGGKAASDPHKETKELMAKVHRGNTYRKGIPRPDASIRNSKQVSAFAEDGSFVATFSSARKASAALCGISPKSISSVINGRLQTAKSSDGSVYQFRLGDDKTPMGSVKHRDTWKNRT